MIWSVKKFVFVHSKTKSNFIIFSFEVCVLVLEKESERAKIICKMIPLLLSFEDSSYLIRMQIPHRTLNQLIQTGTPFTHSVKHFHNWIHLLIENEAVRAQRMSEWISLSNVANFYSWSSYYYSLFVLFNRTEMTWRIHMMHWTKECFSTATTPMTTTTTTNTQFHENVFAY